MKKSDLFEESFKRNFFYPAIFLLLGIIILVGSFSPSELLTNKGANILGLLGVLFTLLGILTLMYLISRKEIYRARFWANEFIESEDRISFSKKQLQESVDRKENARTKMSELMKPST